MRSVYAMLSDCVREGRAASLATIITSEHVTLRPGAKLLIPGDGSPPIGSIHPDLDAAIAADAARLLSEERSEMLAYDLAGASVQVFIESFPPPQHLVIVGAVHIAIPLSRMAKMLGYRVTVVDPRGVFATPERFPDADRLLVEWPEDAFRVVNLNRSAYVVVLTHDLKIDLPALVGALNSEARYVGAIGSRTTVQQRRDALLEMGASEEQVARIHSPIGLPVGARTPAEIAVSIMAEIVAVRRSSPETPRRKDAKGSS